MKGVVPQPSLGHPDDPISRIGLTTMVMNPKSARHVVTGLVFLTNILG